MWSIAKVLLYCANYSIKLQSNGFFVTNRASDDPYSEKVLSESCGSIVWGFLRVCVFLMSQLNIEGHLQEFILILKPVLLLFIWLLTLSL